MPSVLNERLGQWFSPDNMDTLASRVAALEHTVQELASNQQQLLGQQQSILDDVHSIMHTVNKESTYESSRAITALPDRLQKMHNAISNLSESFTSLENVVKQHDYRFNMLRVGFEKNVHLVTIINILSSISVVGTLLWLILIH